MLAKRLVFSIVLGVLGMVDEEAKKTEVLAPYLAC